MMATAQIATTPIVALGADRRGGHRAGLP